MRITYTIATGSLEWLRRLQQQKAAGSTAALDMSAAGCTKGGKKISAKDSYGGCGVYDTV